MISVDIRSLDWLYTSRKCTMKREMSDSPLSNSSALKCDRYKHSPRNDSMSRGRIVTALSERGGRVVRDPISCDLADVSHYEVSPEVTVECQVPGSGSLLVNVYRFTLLPIPCGQV
jgi:hypothetical protein